MHGKCPSVIYRPHLPLSCGTISSFPAYGSQRKRSRWSMVHWPTTGFRPNCLWSMTLITSGGMYNSSLGKNWGSQRQTSLLCTRPDKNSFAKKHLLKDQSKIFLSFCPFGAVQGDSTVEQFRKLRTRQLPKGTSREPGHPGRSHGSATGSCVTSGNFLCPNYLLNNSRVVELICEVLKIAPSFLPGCALGQDAELAFGWNLEMIRLKPHLQGK